MSTGHVPQSALESSGVTISTRGPDLELREAFLKQRAAHRATADGWFRRLVARLFARG